MRTKNSVNPHEANAWGLATTAYAESDSNPLFLRQAFALARKHGFEVPSPVLDYFERCAHALLKPNRFDKGGTPDAHIAAAVEMKARGPRNVYRARADYLRDVEIEVDVHVRGKTATQAAAERYRDYSELVRKRGQRAKPGQRPVRKRKQQSARRCCALTNIKAFPPKWRRPAVCKPCTIARRTEPHCVKPLDL